MSLDDLPGGGCEVWRATEAGDFTAANTHATSLPTRSILDGIDCCRLV
ncbi:hypothetical protein [Stieleria bergensis]